MKCRLKQLLSLSLIMAILMNLVLPAKQIKAASTTTRFGLISYQNAILLNGSQFNETMTYYDTSSHISLNGDQERRITNAEILNDFTKVAYCVEPTEETPGVTWGTVEYSGEDLKDMVGQSYNSGNGIRTFTKDQMDLIQSLIKCGYPGSTDYWTYHGVKDLFVQQMVTQVAIWKVIYPEWGVYDNLSVNTNLYTDSANGNEMLSEMLKIASDIYYKPSYSKPEVNVTSNGYSFNNGIFTSSWNVTVSKAGNGMYINAFDLPNSYVLKVDGSEKSFDSNGKLWLITSDYDNFPTDGSFTVTIETPEISSITLKATAPMVSESDSVYFGLTSQQKVVAADSHFENAYDLLAVTTSYPGLKVDLFKEESVSNANLPDIAFQLREDSATGNILLGANNDWKTDSNGWLGFTPEWDKDYYLIEVDNGNYKDNKAILTSNNVDIEFKLNDPIKFRCDFTSKHLYINDQDAGELYWSDAIQSYNTTSNINDGDAYYVRIYNEKPDITLNITKVDANNNAISGQTFALYDANKNQLETAASVNGKVSFTSKFAWDTQYYISEIQNNGFMPDVEIHINGTVITNKIGDLIPVKFDYDTQTVRIYTSNYPITIANDVASTYTIEYINFARSQIMVTKTDETGTTKLDDCVFGLYLNPTCSNLDLIETKTTNVDGICTFDGLDVNRTFYVKEIKAKHGYALSDDIIAITTTPSKADSFNSTNNYYVYNVTATNKKQHGRIGVTKIGSVLTGFNNNQFVFSNKNVSGVLFGLYENRSDAEDKNNNYIEKVTTTTNNIDYFATRLDIDKKYYVVELDTIDGLYLEKDPKVYEVIIEAPDDKVEIISESINVANTNQKNSVSIYKFNDLENTPIEGALFRITAEEDIYDYDGNLLLAKGSIIEEAASDSQGNVTFASLYPCDYEFRISEVGIPEGFYNKVGDDIFSFMATHDTEIANYHTNIPNTPVIGTAGYGYSATNTSSSQSLDTPNTGDQTHAMYFVFELLVCSAVIILSTKRKKDGNHA